MPRDPKPADESDLFRTDGPGRTMVIPYTTEAVLDAGVTRLGFRRWEARVSWDAGTKARYLSVVRTDRDRAEVALAWLLDMYGEMTRSGVDFTVEPRLNGCSIDAAPASVRRIWGDQSPLDLASELRAAGITQAAAAESLGLAQSTMSRYLSGERTMRPEHVDALRALIRESDAARLDRLSRDVDPPSPVPAAEETP